MTVQRFYQLSSGYRLPSVGLGTWSIPNASTAKVVCSALDCGFRLIDTAVLYGNERECGQGILKWIEQDPQNNKREEVVYTTKLWNSECGYARAKAAIKKCFEKVEGLGYIDLLLIHSPLAGPTARLETWKAMQEAVDEGLVKSIGVSNYGQHHIEQLLSWEGLRYKPVVNQIEISPWLMRQELADFCKSNGIVVEAYAPLAHGGRINDKDVSRLAKKYNVSTAQILIRWSLQKGYVPLPKTKSLERLPSNIDVYNFEISQEDMDILSHPESYDPTDWECTDAP
ncbi:hypothetical protein PACTADRAFT_49833 [Pachysolen tannophilus NRRL Y-2460]|uniref:2-dehydropantolactone reductase n=1 Tax=Pachysolen tannophilus NRRL Y-2460 TaxID=669874 RepID=A0A1E4TXQ5_PACTA|nr:hypothetical protein PACTADRAFT_49833 [Pachysolen tannophilus NRRL Y-2460]